MPGADRRLTPLPGTVDITRNMPLWFHKKSTFLPETIGYMHVVNKIS